MDVDRAGLEQVEAMVRLAGVRDAVTIESILDIVEDYALGVSEKALEKRKAVTRKNVDCICSEWDKKTRVRMSALCSSTKMCSQCRQLLPIEEFYKDANQCGGRQAACKECKRRARRRISRAKRAANCGAIVDPTWFTEETEG